MRPPRTRIVVSKTDESWSLREWHRSRTKTTATSMHALHTSCVRVCNAHFRKSSTVATQSRACLYSVFMSMSHSVSSESTIYKQATRGLAITQI